MVSALAERKKQIRDLGLRVTAPRLAVLRVLAEAERPLSHSEVVLRLGDDAVWDRATVYRNLVALVGGGSGPGDVRTPVRDEPVTTTTSAPSGPSTSSSWPLGSR